MANVVEVVMALNLEIERANPIEWFLGEVVEEMGGDNDRQSSLIASFLPFALQFLQEWIKNCSESRARRGVERAKRSKRARKRLEGRIERNFARLEGIEASDAKDFSVSLFPVAAELDDEGWAALFAN